MASPFFVQPRINYNLCFVQTKKIRDVNPTYKVHITISIVTYTSQLSLEFHDSSSSILVLTHCLTHICVNICRITDNVTFSVNL